MKAERFNFGQNEHARSIGTKASESSWRAQNATRRDENLHLGFRSMHKPRPARNPITEVRVTKNSKHNGPCSRELSLSHKKKSVLRLLSHWLLATAANPRTLTATAPKRPHRTERLKVMLVTQANFLSYLKFSRLFIACAVTLRRECGLSSAFCPRLWSREEVKNCPTSSNNIVVNIPRDSCVFSRDARLR